MEIGASFAYIIDSGEVGRGVEGGRRELRGGSTNRSFDRSASLTH